MKKFFVVISLAALSVLLMCTTSSAAPPVPNPPPADVATIEVDSELPTLLEVGQSETISINVTSCEPFIMTMAMSNAYFPGRGVFFSDSDTATHATSTMLQLTITGKNSTADLPRVCGWYAHETECVGPGVAPLAVVVRILYEGGVTYATQFPFTVTVP